MSSEDRLVFKLKDTKGYIDGSDFADNDLGSIPTNVKSLSLECSRITDAGMKSLPNLNELVCIDLDSTSITDESLKILSGFHNLSEIWLEDTKVTDKGIKHLLSLKHLTFVSLLDTAVTDECVEMLQKHFPGIRVH